MSLRTITDASGQTFTVDVVDTSRQFPLTPWHDKELHPPTRGVSSSYVAEEYPKAVYTSYSTYIEVKNRPEEEAAVAAGGSLNYADFPPPVVVSDTDQIATMRQQIAMLEAMLIKQANERKSKAS